MRGYMREIRQTFRRKQQRYCKVEQVDPVVKKKVLHFVRTALKSWVERGAAVAEVDRFGTEHVAGVRFSCAFLTQQT